MRELRHRLSNVDYASYEFRTQLARRLHRPKGYQRPTGLTSLLLA